MIGDKEYSLGDNEGMKKALLERAEDVALGTSINGDLRKSYADLLAATMFFVIKTGGIVARYEAMNVLAIPTGVLKNGLDSLMQIEQVKPEEEKESIEQMANIIRQNNAAVEGDEL